MAAMRLTPDLIPLLLLIGGVVFVITNAVLMARLRPPDRKRGLLLAEVGIAAVVFLITRLLQRASTDPGLAVVGVKVQYAAGVALVTVGFPDLPFGMPAAPRQRLLTMVRIAGAAIMLMLLATGWIVGGPAGLTGLFAAITTWPGRRVRSSPCSRPTWSASRWRRGACWRRRRSTSPAWFAASGW